MSKTEDCIDSLLKGLEKMVFYDQRFAKPVSGLNSEISPNFASYNFLAPLVSHIPADCQEQAVQVTLQKLVVTFTHCPSPKELRIALADGALKACANSELNQLFEDAKRFLAFPPKDPAEADQWKNQVIFGAIKALGRSHFADVSPQEWGVAVADVVFGDKPMVAYREASREAVTAVQRPYSTLLKKD